MKVMLVDDSKTMRTIQRNILMQLGFKEIEEACDGLDALSKVGPFAPELLLVDWNMPEMNGLEFVQAIRADHGFDSMQLMMVTTETEAEQIVRALEAGANEYVMKPFTKDVILQKLELLRIAS